MTPQWFYRGEQVAIGGAADVKNQRVRDDGFPAIRSLSISFSENQSETFRYFDVFCGTLY